MFATARCVSVPGPSVGPRLIGGPTLPSAARSACGRRAGVGVRCDCWWWSGSFGPCGHWRLGFGHFGVTFCNSKGVPTSATSGKALVFVGFKVVTIAAVR